MIKKRLEKSALNTLKYKYATQQSMAQAAPVDTATQPQLMKQPTQQDGQAPLNSDQLEEAKTLTANRIKQFKKDRLF